MRVILDTNLWISFLISRRYERLDKLLIENKCKLRKELLEEFVEVSRRRRLRKYIPSKELNKILDTIDEFAEFVEITSETKLCRDPKDNFLLSLAMDGQADYLLTGDDDLLELKKVGDTKIMKIAEFLDSRI